MLLFALKRALWSVPVLLVCVTLLSVLVHALAAIDPRVREATSARST
jgi:hypothetical protein